MNISHKNLLNNNKRQYHEKIRNIYYYAYNKYQKEYQDKDYRKEVIKWLFSNNEETRMILCSIENKKYTKLINEAYNHYLKDQSVLMHLKDDDDDDKAEFIYKENNKDNSNDYQYQNKIRFFLNEIMFYQCESPINDYSNYSNYFTLNSNIIKNQKSFQEFYEKFNKDTFLQSPIKIKRDEQHKLSYFYFDFPDWLHRKNISDDNSQSPNSNLALNYSLPEFILALIEQVISIRYIIYKETKDLKEILSNIYLYDLFEKRNKIISYLSQKEKKFSFLYFKIDELVKNLYKDSKLEEFLSNKKESTGFFCSDQYFNIDDDLEKIILDLNIFFNNFLNRNETKDFIDFFMLIHFDKIFTYDDFFFRGVFEKIYDSYAKKVYKDLYFDEDKKVKKKKRKKKKKLKNDNNDNNDKNKDNDNNNDEENNDENNKNKEKILENDIKSSTLNDTENNKDNNEFIDFGDEILKILSDSNSLNNKNENINSNMNDKNAQELDYIKKEKNNLNDNNQKVDNNNNLINNENIFGQIEDKNNNNKKKIKQKNFFLYETTKNNKKKKKNEHKNNKQNIENNIKNNNDKLNEINTNLILNEIKEKEKEDKGKDKETLNLDIKNINNKNSVNYQKESIELNICNNKEENKHSNINNNNKISIPSHINSITFSSSKPDEIKNNKNVIIFNNNIINIQNNIIFQENIFMLNKKLHNNIIEYNTDLEEALVIQRKIKEEITNYFSSLINKLFKDSTLSAYGSSLYKLDIDNSDLDLSISTESNISLSELNDYLLENNDNNKFIKINAILSASVPIIKLEIDYLKMNNDVINELYESLKNTKYYKTYYENKNDNYMNIINIDISLNSANNLQLQFIKDTLIKYPEIKYLIKILKKLLQLKQMNNSYKGGMSSYCLFLLLYSYIKLYFNKDNSNIIINNLDYGSLLTGFLFHYINYVDFNCTIIAPHLINPFVVKGSLDIVPTIIEPTSKKNAGKNIYKIFDVINTFSQIYKDIFFILNNDNTNKNLIYQLLMKYSNT